MTQPRANIRTATRASQIGQPSVSFRNDDFAALIDSKGYTIIIEKAVRCPCEREMGQALVSCQNCYGSGYIFINPLKTKAIASGINRDKTTLKGYKVLDLFGGSGSTLIGAEQTGRNAYLMELYEKYIDVIVKRYHNLGKEDIKLIRDNKEYLWEDIKSEVLNNG